MKPTITLTHNVKILIIIDSDNAIEISLINKFRNPAKLPSVTPNPPGIKETAPTTTDDKYIGIISNIPIFVISYANKMKYTEIEITIQ